jgi:hypothetical protein
VVLVPDPTGSTQVAVLWDSRVTLVQGTAVSCPSVPMVTAGVVTPKLAPVMVMTLPPAVEPSPVTDVTTGAAYLRQGKKRHRARANSRASSHLRQPPPPPKRTKSLPPPPPFT